MAGPNGGALALVRVIHPLPSTLVAVTTAGLALVAGADPSRAALVGLAMLAFQVSIGADNDIHDARSDALVKPTKPIPAGALARQTAAVVAIGSLLVGMILSASFGPVAVLVAMLGVCCGYAHTRWTKGRPIDLLAFGAGIALVPVYAWAAGVGSLPPALAAGIVLAGLAGAGLGLANGLSDLERDRSGGVGSLAERLGVAAARRLVAVILLAAIGGALASLALLDAIGPASGAAVGLVALGAMVAIAGLVIIWRPTARPELGWEVAAVGVGVMAIGCFAAVSGVG